MKRLLFLLLPLLLLPGCAQSEQPVKQQFFAMDTVMSITAYGRNAQEALVQAQQEVNRLDALWSRTKPQSDISHLNFHAGDVSWQEVDPATSSLLAQAQGLCALTSGALDITIAPVMDAWGFGTASSFEESILQVPPTETLDALLPLVDCKGGLQVDRESSRAQLLAPGMAVDLGAVAKGSAATHLQALLLEEDIQSALLDLGGNITAIGLKPDGQPWHIGVKDPLNPEENFCVLSLSDCTISTSGAYERYFEEDGQRYHHILRPDTGYPVESGLLSVTVVSSDGTLADAMSTACFVLGSEDSIALWRDLQQDLDLILVGADGTVLVTEGLEDRFGFQGEEGGYTHEIVRR